MREMRTGLMGLVWQWWFNLSDFSVTLSIGFRVKADEFRLVDKPLSVDREGIPKYGSRSDGHLSGLDVTIQFVQPTRDS